MDYAYQDIAGMIDHALLAPTLMADALDAGCRLAVACQVASVCIVPWALGRCAELLAGSGVRPGTVIGFPHGANATSVKAAEAERAVADGGEELDMVVNLSQVLGGDWAYVRADIQAVIDVAHAAGGKVKVIFETCCLDDAQKVRLCEICGELGADWVKTSTGFGAGGATVADVRLLRENSPARVQVKAAGGIRDLDALLAMRAAGATRVGASRTAAILDECKRRLGLER